MKKASLYLIIAHLYLIACVAVSVIILGKIKELEALETKKYEEWMVRAETICAMPVKSFSVTQTELRVECGGLNE